MLPAENLRHDIEEKYKIDLSRYAWSKELKEEIFKIELDKKLEYHADTLEDIYKLGFNIGHCELTSRYITINHQKAKLFYGKAALLVGTKSSPNGEHGWTVIDDYLLDSTLMLCIPISEIQNFGYIPEKEIAYNSARVLPEYDTYDLEYNRMDQDKTKKMVYKKTNY
jgi:hypothetical protein